MQVQMQVVGRFDAYVIAVAIIIAGIVVANALADGFNTLRSSIVYHGEITR